MLAAIRLQYTNNFIEMTNAIVINRNKTTYVKLINGYDNELKNNEYKYITNKIDTSQKSIN